MGQDKARLRVNGRQLLDHSLDRLHALGITDCWVSGSYPGYRCIEDQSPASGPVAALHSLAIALPNTKMLIVPVDMPALDQRLLRHLLDSGTDARCAHFRAAPLPLRLITDGIAAQAIAACINQSDRDQRSLRNVLSRLEAKVIEPPEWADPGALTSVNTPSEWAEWLANSVTE